MAFHQGADAEHGVFVDAPIADGAEAEARDGVCTGRKFVVLNGLGAREEGPVVVGVQRRFREPSVKRDAIAALFAAEGACGGPPAVLANRMRVDGACGPTSFVLVRMQLLRAVDVGP